MKKNQDLELDMQSQLLGRRRARGSSFQTSPGKKLVRPHLSGEKLGLIMQTYHPRYTGRNSIKYENRGPGWPGHKSKTLFEK
jgi:hypothetical protein